MLLRHGSDLPTLEAVFLLSIEQQFCLPQPLPDQCLACSLAGLHLVQRVAVVGNNAVGKGATRPTPQN